MALLTVTVLLVLGLAVTTVSMGTLKSNVADATTNDAYYAAAAAVNSAIEHIKHEVSSYYAAMADSSGTIYDALYQNFYANINALASQSFIEPAISGAATDTSFSVGSFDPSLQAGEFVISATSTTADGTQYKVNGNVIVKRLDLTSGSWFVPNTVLYIGGAIDLDTDRQMSVTGNVIAGELRELNASPWYSRFSHQGGSLLIDPLAGNALSDVASYSSYTDPVLPTVNVYITQNNYNYSAGSAGTIYITTAPGVNISLSNSGIAGGIVHGKGNINIPSIGNVYADIYADGNLTIGGGNFYGNLYCRGNLTITGGTFHGDIMCDGSISASSFSANGLIMAGGNITVTNTSYAGSLYAAGTISLSQVYSAGVIYSSTRINFGNGTINGIIYSYGDVAITAGCSVGGALFAKGNIYYATTSKQDTLVIEYSQTVVNNALSNPKILSFHRCRREQRNGH